MADNPSKEYPCAYCRRTIIKNETTRQWEDEVDLYLCPRGFNGTGGSHSPDYNAQHWKAME